MLSLYDLTHFVRPKFSIKQIMWVRINVQV